MKSFRKKDSLKEEVLVKNIFMTSGKMRQRKVYFANLFAKKWERQIKESQLLRSLNSVDCREKRDREKVENCGLQDR